MGRLKKLAGVAVAATGLQYFYNDPHAWENLKHTAAEIVKPAAATSPNHVEFSPNSSNSSPWTRMFSFWNTATPPVQTESIPNYDPGELLRFDLTPRQVLDRWPRVSTVLSDQNLEGLRAPIVTGTNPDDIAGSITYYFNRQHQVQRIVLHGFAGDERKLVSVATQYGLKPEPTLGAGLYCTKWNGRPVNVLRVSHAPVVRASALNSRLEVMLELNRPGGGAALSQEFRQILDADKQVSRW